MEHIKLYDKFGDVCVNGTSAKRFADEEIVPFLIAGKSVVIDFEGVEMASSSFINSLIFNTYGYGVSEDQVKYKTEDDLISSMIHTCISKLVKHTE